MTTGFLSRTVHYAGGVARYVVYVPWWYDAARPLPAIVFLHGRGEEGDDGWKPVAVGLGPAILADARRWDFIVIFPQKPAGRAGWGAHRDLVLAALDDTRREFAVDASRIYLTGLSMGGTGTWAIGARERHLFAALVPICGGGSVADARRLARMPVWCFHGAKDDAVPPDASRRMVQAMRAAGGNPRLTIYEGVGHGAWERAYAEPELPAWLLSHARS